MKSSQQLPASAQTRPQRKSGTSTAKLGWSLRLTPPWSEHAFWSSTCCHEWMDVIDKWCMSFTLVGYAMLAPNLWAQGPSPLHNACAVAVFLCVLQLLLRVRCQRLYIRWRPVALYASRLVRLVIFLCTILALNNEPQPLTQVCWQPSYESMLDNSTATATGTSSFSNIRLTGSASLALLAVSHAVNAPLPFIPQLLFQLLYFLLLTFLQAPYAVNALRSLVPNAASQQLCLSLNTFTQKMETYLLVVQRQDQAYFQSTCLTNAPAVNILFINLVVGLLIPVFISYRIEQLQKTRFLQQPHLSTSVDFPPSEMVNASQTQPPPTSQKQISLLSLLNLFSITDIPLSLCVAAFCWALSVHAEPLLSSVASATLTALGLPAPIPVV